MALKQHSKKIQSKEERARKFNRKRENMLARETIGDRQKVREPDKNAERIHKPICLLNYQKSYH
jgi:hypothetical protein